MIFRRKKKQKKKTVAYTETYSLKIKLQEKQWFF